MKTKLPASIQSAAEAKKFLAALEKNGESFHPEDPAEEIINASGRLFTDAEARKVNRLMQQVFEFLTDPCEYLLSLQVKFNDEGIEQPFEITGTFSDHNGISTFTPGWFESDDAADWYANSWEMVEDALNDPYRD